MTFPGVYPVLATPFRDDESFDESFDESSMRSMLELMARLGVDGVRPLDVAAILSGP